MAGIKGRETPPRGKKRKNKERKDKARKNDEFRQ